MRKIIEMSFFNDQLTNMPAVAGLLKQTYCLGDKSSCARYQVSIAGVPVPVDLFPNEIGRIAQIMKKK